MEFIFIFTVVLIEIRRIDLLKVMKVIGAFRVHTFVDGKVFPVFLWNKSIAAVWASQFHGGEAALCRREPCGTDFAEDLPFRAIVFVKEGFGSITAGAGAFVRDITLGASADRAYFLTIAFFVVRDEFFVGPVLTEVSDKG